MLSLRVQRLKDMSIPVGTGWLLGSCMEARGKQDVWLRSKPEVLAALREEAIVQSAESSNRIEGVTVDAGRLRPLLLKREPPRDRPEEELAGYRKALDWIFSRKRSVPVSPVLILKLHEMAQGGTTGDAGEWKKRDNEVVEFLPNGERRVRFVATPAREAPKAVEMLCRNYRQACDMTDFPPLLAVATFVFDLLCIHPFRDGNGRVSRLATTLLLDQHGFSVARYVSLERLVEEDKGEYYRVLAECSAGWHQGTNEVVPWWNYFLSTLRQAYRRLERRVESADARPAKSDLVRRLVLSQVGPFSLAEIAALSPATSRHLVKKVLAELRDSGNIRLTGKGRSAIWEVVTAKSRR